MAPEAHPMKARDNPFSTDRVLRVRYQLHDMTWPQLLASLEMLDAEHLLMFASDYPHWDFDSPTHAFPKLPAALHERIFSTNARTFYRLG